MPKLEDRFITHIQRPHSMPNGKKSLASLFFLTTHEGAIDENGNPEYFLGKDTHAIPETCVLKKLANGRMIKMPETLNGEFANTNKIFLERGKNLWMDSDFNVYWGEETDRKNFWTKRKDVTKTTPIFSLKGQLTAEI